MSNMQNPPSEIMFLTNPENNTDERKFRLAAFQPLGVGLVIVMGNAEETSEDFLVFALMQSIFNKNVLSMQEVINIFNAQGKKVGFMGIFIAYIKTKFSLQDKLIILEQTSLSQEQKQHFLEEAPNPNA